MRMLVAPHGGASQMQMMHDPLNAQLWGRWVPGDGGAMRDLLWVRLERVAPSEFDMLPYEQQSPATGGLTGLRLLYCKTLL